MKKHKILISFLLITVLSSFLFFNSIVTTEAAVKYSYGFTSKDSVTNNFETSSVKLDINEKFTPPKAWDGSNYEKIVNIKNVGKADSLVRVAITTRWLDHDGNPWLGNNNYVELQYPQDFNENWLNGNDGFYYYKKELKVNEMTSKILEGVKLNIPSNFKKMYSGKQLIVDIDIEGVQTKNEAYKKLWGNLDSDVQNLFSNICLKGNGK